MNKKGFDVNQIFIYVVAIVVVAFVLSFGTQAVFKFMQSSEEIQETKYIKDFRSMADRVSSNYGMVRYVEPKTLGKYQEICIIDIDKFEDIDTTLANEDSLKCQSDSDPSYFALGFELCDIWQEMATNPDMENKNFFYLGRERVIESSHYIENIQPITTGTQQGPYLCIDSRGQEQMRFEGIGRIAKVSVE